MVTARSVCREQLPYPLWLAVRMMPGIWARGLCKLQFLSLLLTRSYRGLIPALNWWDMIDEHFCLGGTLMFNDIERLRQQGVGAVINLCAERHDDRLRLAQAHMAYLWLPVIDTCAPTCEQIDLGMRWIGHQLRTGRVLYIHCAAGVGRSATLLACWYIHAQGLSASQALYRLKTRRPQVFLTRRQRQRLHAYAARRQGPRPHDTGAWSSAAADLGGDACVPALKSEHRP